MSKRILCLLGTGFEEIEAITPIDVLRRAGAKVTLAAVGDEMLVKGRSGITVQADVLLANVSPDDFDVLLLPGGPGVKALREDGRPAQLAARFHAAEKVVAAICAAPTVLHDADLLSGKRFTAHFSVHGELPTALGDERVITDGFLTTSRGAGTALDFSLELVRRLYGQERADEIAASIMA
jgi:protein deglycase